MSNRKSKSVFDEWSETKRRAQRTAVFRLAFSAIYVGFYVIMSVPGFALAQGAHCFVSLLFFCVFTIPVIRNSHFARVIAGPVSGYFRTIMDVLQASLLVHATGGLDSPFLIGLSIPVVFSSYGRDQWRGRTAALISLALTMGSESLTTLGWLSDLNIWGRGSTPSALWQILLFGGALAIALFGIATVSNRLYVTSLEAREDAERERRNTEKLNEFSKALNASTDFDSVIERIVGYMQSEYSIDSAILLLKEDTTDDLITSRIFTSPAADPGVDEYGRALRIASGQIGMIGRTALRKKPLYIATNARRDIFRRPYPGIEQDREIVTSLQLTWFLLLPLVVQGDCIGLLMVTSYSRPEGLTPQEIGNVERFGEQIGGAIYASNLLTRITEERDRVETARTAADSLRLLAERASTKISLGDMIDTVLDFVEKQFGLSYFGFYFVDQKGENLVHYRSRHGADVPASAADFLKNTLLPLNHESSAVAAAVLRRRTMYLRKIPRTKMSLDKELVGFAGLGSVIVAPMWVEDRPLGALIASQYRAEMKLSRDQIHQIEAFCAQVAGMIYTTRLLEQTAAARAEADRAAQEIEKARKELEKLNEVSKLMNSTSDLVQILDHVFAYLGATYGFDGFILMTPEKSAAPGLSVWRHVDSTRPESVFAYSRSLRIPLDGTGGLIERAFKRLGPILVPDTHQNIFRVNYPGSERDREIVEKFFLRAFLLLPLVLQGESIAIVMCAASKPLHLDKSERASIGRFAAQVAGAVHTTNLLGNVTRERDRAEIARKEAESSREETERLADIARSINETTDVDQILDSIFLHLRRTFGARDLVLQLVDEEKKELWTMRAASSEDRNQEDINWGLTLRVPLVPESGTLYRTYQKRRPLYLARVEGNIHPTQLDAEIVTRLNLKSLAQFPLVIQKRTIGILWLSFGADRRTRADIQSIARFCDQIAGAVYGSNLLKEVSEARARADEEWRRAEEERQRTQTLADFARRVNESSDLGRIIEDVTRYVVETMNLFGASLSLVDEKANSLYHGGGYRRHTTPEQQAYFDNIRIPLVPESGTLYMTYRRKRSIYLSKFGRVDSPVDQRVVDIFGFRSFAQIPLKIGEQVLGILTLDPGDTRLRKNDIRKVEAFVDQIAGAVQNARMLQESRAARRESDKAREEIALLADLSRHANEGRTLDDVLAAVLDTLTKRFGVNSVVLYTVATRDKALVMRSAFHEGAPRAVNSFPENITTVPIVPASGTLFRTYGKKKIFYTNRVNAEWLKTSPVDAAVAGAFGFDWFVQAPLLVDNNVVGIFSFTGQNEQRLTKADLQFTERVAAQIAGAVRAVELLKETQEAQGDIERMADVTRRLNETTDLRVIATGVFNYMHERFGVTRSALLLVDEKAGLIKGGNDSNQGEESFWMNFSAPLAPETGALYRTYLKQKPLYLKRIPAAGLGKIDSEIVAAGALKSFIQVPLVVHEKTVGIVASSADQPLHRSDIDGIVRLCDQIAGAVQNARLLEESRTARQESERAREETEILSELARKANEGRSLNDILSAVAEITQRKFQADRLGIYFVDRQNQKLTLPAVFYDALPARLADFPEMPTEIPLTPEGGTLFRTYKKMRTFHLSEINEIWLNTSPIDGRICRALHLEWFVHVPLMVEGEIIGILFFTGPVRRHLTKVELTFCGRVGAQVAGAVRSMELLRQAEDARREAAEAARATAQLNQFSRDVSDNISVEVMADRVFKVLAEKYGLDYFGLYLADETRSELRGDRSFPLEGLEAERKFFQTFRVPLDRRSGLMGIALRRGHPFFIESFEDVKLSDVERTLQKNLRLKSLVMVPLKAGGRLVGAVAASRLDEQFKFTEADMRSFAIFCQQIAGALHTAALLERARAEREKSDQLLANILPASVAQELKREGRVEPLFYDAVTVLFTDFVGFTQATQTMRPDELIDELDGCFSQFDEVVERNNMEKLKTIGDAYMCASGLPTLSPTHAIDACLTALEFRSFMNQMAEIKKSLGHPFWQLRIGIHSGPVTAGVIGTKKFAYDIWGDTVNTASRMESSGKPGQVNISGDTYELVKDFFECEHRGKVVAKGKGEMDMYFLLRIKPELSANEEGLLPNARFEMMRAGLVPQL